MNKQLDAEDFYNAWLVKYHGISIRELLDKDPELLKSPEWYAKYAVTQRQYDEWYEWAITTVAKHYKWSRTKTKKEFCLAWLNVSPTIKDNEYKNFY